MPAATELAIEKPRSGANAFQKDLDSGRAWRDREQRRVPSPPRLTSRSSQRVPRKLQV